MKKFTTIATTIILILALAATFSACGHRKEETLNTPEPTPTTQPTTLTDEIVEPKEDWYLENDTLYGPNDFKKNIEQQSHYQIVENYKNRVLLFDYTKRELYLADAENKNFYCISDNNIIINYTVAYDTVYFFNTDSDVWAVEWWKTEKPSAVLYYKDAIAVSPFMDEGEGAVVKPEEANWEEYGLSIYSPYGN